MPRVLAADGYSSDVACESTSAANGPSLAHVTRRPWVLTSRLFRRRGQLTTALATSGKCDGLARWAENAGV